MLPRMQESPSSLLVWLKHSNPKSTLWLPQFLEYRLLSSLPTFLNCKASWTHSLYLLALIFLAILVEVDAKDSALAELLAFALMPVTIKTPAPTMLVFQDKEEMDAFTHPSAALITMHALKTLVIQIQDASTETSPATTAILASSSLAFLQSDVNPSTRLALTTILALLITAILAFLEDAHSHSSLEVADLASMFPLEIPSPALKCPVKSDPAIQQTVSARELQSVAMTTTGAPLIHAILQLEDASTPLSTVMMEMLALMTTATLLSDASIPHST